MPKFTIKKFVMKKKQCSLCKRILEMRNFTRDDYQMSDRCWFCEDWNRDYWKRPRTNNNCTHT